MVRRDGAEARKERIAQIARSIQAALFQNKETRWIPLSKTVSLIMIDTGLRKDTVMEYIQLLSDAEQFSLDKSKDKISRVNV